MKKKIIVIVMMFMLFMGVVSASSINGDYGGNPIVKIKSNGKVLPVEDTPAIVYDGRTMVPIYMLKQLGVNVTWDQNTYSVDVKLPKQETNIDQTSGIKNIKMYSKIADHYKRISMLGETLWQLGRNFYITYDYISSNRSDSYEVLMVSHDRISKGIDSYNNLLNETSFIISEAQKSGIPLSDMNNQLSKYSSGIDYYKKSLDGLNNYYSMKSSKNFSDYLDNVKIADAFIDPAIREANEKYYYWYDKVQNY